jgi:hypothetical protein
MHHTDTIQRHSDEQRCSTLLGSWQVEGAGEGYFATLPAVIHTRLDDRPRATLGKPAFALSGLTAAAVVCVMLISVWNIRQQQAFQERLISAAASWSAERSTGAAELRDDELADPRDDASDESLGTAVEHMTIENKSGYQLLDDLSNDEIKQVVSALTTTRG